MLNSSFIYNSKNLNMKFKHSIDEIVIYLLISWNFVRMEGLKENII